MTGPYDPLRIRFAVNARNEWVYLQFGGLENPHVLIVGGSQTGKTTLEKLLVAAAAAAGCIVIVLDPKMRFAKHFRDVPHVLVYRNEDSDIAAQEWEGALEFAQAEMQQRYRLDDEATADILDDQRRFPPILVVTDEFKTLMSVAQDEWPNRRPDGGRAESPTRRMFPNLMRMGAEARLFCVTATHTAHADALPAGTETRSLCGNRIVLGTDRELTSWQVIAGFGIAKPPVPENQKGAAVFLVGTRDAERIQCALIENDQLRDLAMQGLGRLREDGHITDDGHVIMAGQPMPRPGRMSSHVAAGLTLGTAAADLPVAAPQAVSPAPEPEFPMVRGLREGALFCQMSISNFRKHRDNYPIPGEAKPDGKTPVWREDDLREWSMFREANSRRSRSSDERREA